MKLFYPEFLWALFAILIPIAIHLFNFKKFKKVYFSNITFLKEVKLETQSKSKLKHLLVLFTRIIAIILIVLAFCQPYFESHVKVRDVTNSIAIYLDNSQSMDAKTTDGYLFDIAKETAVEIVKGYSATDDFQLLTNDFEGKHQRLVSQEEMLKLINEVTLTPLSKDFKEVYEREKDLLKNSKGNKEVFWLSDFQKNNFNIADLALDSLMNFKLISFKQEELKNLYIDSVWFTSPLRQLNQDESLNVRIVNKSDDELGTKVNLKINNEIKGILNTTVEANSNKIVELNYSIQKRGEQLGAVYLSDYPDPTLTFDDEFLFSYSINKESNILYLSDKLNVDSSENVVAVFSGDNNYSLTVQNFSTVDYSKLSQFQLLVINNSNALSNGFQNELEQYLTNGGNVLLIPSSNIDLLSYQSFFSSVLKAKLSSKVSGSFKVGKINNEHLIYSNVFEKLPQNLDLPLSAAYYPSVFETRSSTSNLLSFQNDSPFFTASKVGKGNFYFLASALSETSFSQHALFVPSLLRVAENSNVSYPMYYEIGSKGLVKINKNMNEGEVEVKELGTDFVFLPEVIKNNSGSSIDVHDKIMSANHFQLYINNEKSIPLTYNYSRTESELLYYTDNELKELISNSQLNQSFEVIAQPQNGNYTQLSSITQNQKYWKYFIIGALLMLLIEILLIRFFR